MRHRNASTIQLTKQTDRSPPPTKKKKLAWWTPFAAQKMHNHHAKPLSRLLIHRRSAVPRAENVILSIPLPHCNRKGKAAVQQRKKKAKGTRAKKLHHPPAGAAAPESLRLLKSCIVTLLARTSPWTRCMGGHGVMGRNGPLRFSLRKLFFLCQRSVLL